MLISIIIIILTFEMFLQEFLKKEFSDENIVFWIACENFRNITDFEEVRKLFCVTSLYTNNNDCLALSKIFETKEITSCHACK